MAVQQTKRLCSLAATTGTSEACPEEACPFWEPGGAALGGRCAVEALGGVADPTAAAWLLEIRETLLAASSEEDASELRSVFHQLLNDSSE